MRNFSKTMTLFLVMAFALSCIGSVVAYGLDREQVDSVKLSIEQSFKGEMKSLEIDKSNFGLSENETFYDATLGDGHAFYTLSDGFLTNVSDEALTLSGYIFPIELNNKPCGIAIVQEINGIMEIVGKTNNLTFEKDIREAKALVQDGFSPKLVYDYSFRIYALAFGEGSEQSLMPLKDNDNFGLEKHQTIALRTISDDLHSTYRQRMKDSSALGGGVGEEPAATGNMLLPAVMFILACVGIVVCMKLKRVHL